MKFKVIISGQVDDMRVFMDLRTTSYTRLEQLRKYSSKNKLNYKMEIIDDE